MVLSLDRELHRTKQSWLLPPYPGKSEVTFDCSRQSAPTNRTSVHQHFLKRCRSCQMTSQAMSVFNLITTLHQSGPVNPVDNRKQGGTHRVVGRPGETGSIITANLAPKISFCCREFRSYPESGISVVESNLARRLGSSKVECVSWGALTNRDEFADKKLSKIYKDRLQPFVRRWIEIICHKASAESLSTQIQQKLGTLRMRRLS